MVKPDKSLKVLYLKLTIVSFIFILTLVGFILSLGFYEKEIMKKIQNINLLKKEIIKNQVAKDEEAKFKQLFNLFLEKTGREIKTVLYDFQEKSNLDNEKIKNLFSEKIKKEKWEVSNFSVDDNKINISFIVPINEINKFFEFIESNFLLLTRIKNLKIERNDKYFFLEINL